MMGLNEVLRGQVRPNKDAAGLTVPRRRHPGRGGPRNGLWGFREFREPPSHACEHSGLGDHSAMAAPNSSEFPAAAACACARYAYS